MFLFCFGWYLLYSHMVSLLCSSPPPYTCSYSHEHSSSYQRGERNVFIQKSLKHKPEEWELFKNEKLKKRKEKLTFHSSLSLHHSVQQMESRDGNFWNHRSNHPKNILLKLKLDCSMSPTLQSLSFSQFPAHSEHGLSGVQQESKPPFCDEGDISKS